MKYILLFVVSLLTFVASFSQGDKKSRIKKYNKKKFFSGNYYYIYSNNPAAGHDSIRLVKADRAFWGSITESGSLVIVRQDRIDKKRNGAIVFTTIETAHTPFTTGSKVDNADLIYFPETVYPEQSSALTDNGIIPKRIGYRDYKFVLQALTIPLRFRKSIDTIPNQVETGLNIGFSGGIKWSYNWLSADKSFLGQKTNSISFTPGLLLGASAIDVKAKVNAAKDFRDRKAPAITYGGFFMIGINNINIGFALGTDRALGVAGKSNGWIYDNKLWMGVAIALDLIK